jgi:hypothetical protein
MDLPMKLRLEGYVVDSMTSTSLPIKNLLIPANNRHKTTTNERDRKAIPSQFIIYLLNQFSGEKPGCGF